MKDNYDVVIVGSGVSGLYAALQFSSDISVLVISKRELSLSNSSLAQGGVAAVIDKDNDNYKLHIADTLIAGGYKNDLSALEVLVTEGPSDVLKLRELGVQFDSDSQGNLSMTLEGGHSRHRIAHHKDSTGREIVRKLLELVAEKPNVELLENTLLCSLQKDSGGGFWLGIMTSEGEIRPVFAPYVILGTGGIGRVFKYTTNSAIATGDGITMAYNLGAKIKNLSYIQFHPTGFAPKDDSHERFLISEAVRGEGAVLRNVNGDRFVENYDYRGELAPRDVVSRIIIQEGQRLHSDKFYLDITHEDADFVKSRFPMIYEKCLEEGIDMTKEGIPIYPTQHYLMGGINVDTKARTNVPGLYAVGECSHTGIHGKNRLASNSLLEALVFSRRAATDIILNICVNGCVKPKDEPKMPSKEGKPLRKGIRTTIRNILQEAHFVTLNIDKAIENMPVIEDLLKEVYADDLAMSKDLIEARSAVTVAYIVLNEDIENAKNNN
ncbi:MAG: L-aspartate oxidase [Clostridia bacterium]|nr:L-aspartate oxidase [Clostridia bacterium]